MKRNTQQLKDLTIQVRRDILRMVHNVNSGHPGGSLGCTEFMVAIPKFMDQKRRFDMDIEKIFSSFKRTFLTCFL
jgi:transketolase